MPASSHHEDSNLISALYALSKKSPKLVKSSTYPAPADPSITVRSWKMNEYRYYDVPSPFPTLARGIFTVEEKGATDTDADADAQPKYRIVARGYDKFFNIGEVPWVTWPALKSNTSPPYTLSLKSNGCIIFIAALTPTKLLITSKHSLGPVQGVETSHAQAGERWLRKYLDKKGRKEEELARELWEGNLTAIAELCDDSFEEHVLPYPPHKTGLHLHGLNTNTKSFHTLPAPQVDAFAGEWGFIQTPTVRLGSLEEVRRFTDEVAETGVWEGVMVEGFVVRTVTRSADGVGEEAELREEGLSTTETVDDLQEGEGGNKGKHKTPGSKKSTTSPYPPNSTFFFKIKFDEPYMMYRDWRELTKKLLSLHSSSSSTSPSSKLTMSALPQSKLHRPETRIYVRWVIGEIKRDPGAFEGYTKGKGIVSTRERFLEFLESEEGRKEVGRVGVGKKEREKEREKEKGEEESVGGKELRKTIIVPVAIPGCGKTAVSVALAHIFKFGHTQSDDVGKKKRAGAQFIKNVTELLGKHDVVIADKNNHLIQHRKALRDITTTHPHTLGRTRLLALNWDLSTAPPATIHRICSDRIVQRGENHQTLRPTIANATTTAGSRRRTMDDDDDERTHEDVVWMFLTTREELGLSEVDEVIDMYLTSTDTDNKEKNHVEDGGGGDVSMEQSIRRAVDGIVRVLGLTQPSEEMIMEGVRAAEEYRPTITGGGVGVGVKKETGGVMAGEEKKKKKKKKRQGPARYYALVLEELDLEEMLGKALANLHNTESGVEKAAIEAWTGLKTAGRVDPTRPHVTVVHRNSLPEQKDLWDRCAELDIDGEEDNSNAPPPLMFRARLGNLVWNEDVMALTVDELGLAAVVSENDVISRKGKDFLDELPEKVRQRLHVTVATASESVPPVRAKALVEAWRDGRKTAADGDGEIRSIALEGVYATGKIRGLVH